MKQYLPQVKEVMGVLLDILKQSESDRRAEVDIHFTTDVRIIKRVKRKKEIFDVLDTLTATGVSNMEATLAHTLYDYLAKLDKVNRTTLLRLLSPKKMASRGLNFYVLTDGMWQPNNDPARAIKPLKRHLEERNLPENQIGIQFIRFGHEKREIVLLKQLDTDTFTDIVDTESASGNVWKMLLGATNRWFDYDTNKPSDGSQS